MPVLLVIVRDPGGRSDDEYLFSTELDAAVETVARAYADRWAIEETHRNCKQFLGAEDPQCWHRQGPERAGALSLFIYSLVWYWYVVVHGGRPAGNGTLGTRKPRLPSWMRWPRPGASGGGSGFLLRAIAVPSHGKFQAALIETLAYAA